MSRVRIFGIGSPSGDDQAGWLTVDALLACGVISGEGIRIDKLDRPGANLIALLSDVDRVILIDAMQSDGQIGRVQRFDRQDWPRYGQGLSSHGLGVLDALSLARELGGLPSRLDLYGIEIGLALPGQGPSLPVQTAAQTLARMIADELDSPH
jgi:hydrogenase maturation protease